MGGWQVDQGRVFSRLQLRQLLATAEGAAALAKQGGRRCAVVRGATVELACLAGLRVSEIAALKCADVTTEGQKPQVMVRHGKGDKRRVVALVGPLKGLCRELGGYMAWKREVGEDVGPEAPLLARKHKGTWVHYTPDALKYQFKQALVASGCIDPARFSIHCGRHTAATYLYGRTRNLRLVQRVLGHVSPTITAQYAQIISDWDAMADAGDGPLWEE